MDVGYVPWRIRLLSNCRGAGLCTSWTGVSAATCLKNSVVQSKRFTVGTPGKKGLQPAEFAGFCPDSERILLCFVATKKTSTCPPAAGETPDFSIKPKRLGLPQSQESGLGQLEVPGQKQQRPSPANSMREVTRKTQGHPHTCGRKERYQGQDLGPEGTVAQTRQDGGTWQRDTVLSALGLLSWERERVLFPSLSHLRSPEAGGGWALIDSLTKTSHRREEQFPERKGKRLDSRR